jgi:hypothetical protein
MHSESSPIRVGLYIDRTLWQTLRIVAIQQHVSASQLMTRLICQEIQRWHATPAKETDHDEVRS